MNMKLGDPKQKRRSVAVRTIADDYKNMLRAHGLQPALLRVLKDRSDLSLIEIMNDLGGVHARDAF